MTDAEAFLALFKGNERAYGVTKYGDVRESDGKIQGVSQLLWDKVQLTVIEKHLNGEVSIGLSPLLDDGTCRWAAIDLDEYQGDIYLIVQAIEDFDIPLLPCFSKSKHLHLYAFFSSPVPAERVVEYLRLYIPLFRLPPKVEIFPKQTRTNATTKFPSWINLPYYNTEKGERVCLRGKNQYRTLEEFLTVAKSKQISIEEHEARLEYLPYYAAPPCISSGAILRDVGRGQRNRWFYNVACYLRMQDEEIELEDPILELNSTLLDPLPEEELLNTVCKLKAKTAFYQCEGMSGCIKEYCRKSEYGVGNRTDATGFSLGQLTKVESDPIYWRWEVNGKVLTFYNTDEIMKQAAFRKQCMERLNILPFQVKDEKWTAIIRRHLETLKIETVNKIGDFGVGAMFRQELAKFFAKDRDRAQDLSQVVANGKILESGGFYYFKATILQDFITELHRVKGVSEGMIRERMLELGAVQEGEVWKVPVDSMPEYKEAQVEIDYKMREGEESVEF